MKNSEIIADAALKAGIYQKEEIDHIMKEKGELPIHTATMWLQLGKKVKPGEEPCAYARLWRFRPADSGEDTDSGFFAAKSALYKDDQVEDWREA